MRNRSPGPLRWLLDLGRDWVDSVHLPNRRAVALAISFLIVLGGLLSASGFVRSNPESPLQGQQLAKNSLPELVLPSLVDDPSAGYLLSFGGFQPPEIPSAITLEYANGLWTNLTSELSPAPAPRFAASMAYDPNIGGVILYGGCLTLNCYPALNDTWIFKSGAWTDITSIVGRAPSPRGGAMLAWDPSNSDLVLFGGGGGASPNALYNDTWEFSGNHWLNVTSSLTGPSPPPMLLGQMASNTTGPVVLFGGSGAKGNMADTWTFSGRSWTNDTTGVGNHPIPRSEGMFSAASAAGGLLLMGGTGGTGYLSDTWILSSNHWREISSVIPGVPSLGGAGIAYDSRDGYVVMFGGQSPGCGATCAAGYYWTYSNGSWTLQNPQTTSPLQGLLGTITQLLPVSLIPLLALELVVISWAQSRRIRKVERLVANPDPSRAAWYATIPRSLAYRNLRRGGIIMGGIIGSFSVIFLFLINSAPPGLSTADPALLVFLAFIVLLPVLLILAQLPTVTLSIGLSDEALFIRRPRRTLTIPWEYVQPPNLAPKGPLLYFHFSTPGSNSTPLGFTTTIEQARAILNYPAAAYWSVPPHVTAKLGLSPRGQGHGATTTEPLPSQTRQAPLPAGRGGSNAPNSVPQFCRRCGGVLGPSASSCPSCGAPVD